ncbi:MAG: Elongation factor Ts [candidate division WS6 bacterium OLB21]|uniref:Elongation factor Ts n=1 Tax=candidate division WS6 bacterium OLB21 TaxID=1617427 RepID=A0A136KJN6_9BACT|nr:MAG: Elongation factor Ts [candidate division WS6 bacterium OLB21]
MQITLEQIKELRKLTGAGVTNVKEALEHSKGDIDKAVEYLREKGVAKAAKRADKQADKGFIAHYIHGDGTIGVLVELNAETDFTARNEKFRELAHNLALHIAANKPEYISRENVPADILNKEKEIAKASIEGNKPEAVVEKNSRRKNAKVLRRGCLT